MTPPPDPSSLYLVFGDQEGREGWWGAGVGSYLVLSARHSDKNRSEPISTSSGRSFLRVSGSNSISCLLSGAPLSHTLGDLGRSTTGENRLQKRKNRIQPRRGNCCVPIMMCEFVMNCDSRSQILDHMGT